MQEHIVTVGCFHLRSNLWHGHARATSAPRLNLSDSRLRTKLFFNQSDKAVNKTLKRTRWCSRKFGVCFIGNYMCFASFPMFFFFTFISHRPGTGFNVISVWNETPLTKTCLCFLLYCDGNKKSWNNQAVTEPIIWMQRCQTLFFC